jgi:hypothetical protein
MRDLKADIDSFSSGGEDHFRCDLRNKANELAL